MTAPDVTTAVERVRRDCVPGTILTTTYTEDLAAILSELDRLSAALGEAREWRPMQDAPRDGTPFYARSLGAFRFQPYKPNSQEARRGVKGRWQSMNEYGGWENCMSPMGDWKPHPDFPVPARTALQQQEARDGRE